MSSILRAPQLSIEKRKLGMRSPETAPAPARQAPTAATAAPVVDEQAAMQAHIMREAERLSQEAREGVLTEAKREIAAARESARQEGLHQGREEGEAAARKAADAAAARLSTVTKALESALARGIGDAEDVMVTIVFEAVTKIVGDLAPTTEGIRAMVRAAAARTTASRRIVVRLHPDDLSVLRDAGALEGVLPTEPAPSWVADQTVVLGGCVLETDHGELDARLETQLERLRLALLGARVGRSQGA